MALITIDLRFLSQYGSNFNYSSAWEIDIAISTNLAITDISSVSLPEAFLPTTYNKSQVIEIMLIARKNIQFHIDMAIKNASFLDARYSFVNSTSVDKVSPYRALYPKQVSFFTKLTPEDAVSLPMNIIELDANSNFPDYWIDLASVRGEDESLIKHATITGTNFFYPKSAFWESLADDYVTMPYLPFFSNCKAFDNHIPIFAIFEQNPKCDLVSVEDTIYTAPFHFKSFPIADRCVDIDFECIYDENLDQVTDYPRWFEQGPDILFYITKDPQDASKLENDKFNLKQENVYLIPHKLN